MFIANTLPERGAPLDPADAAIVDGAAADAVERWLSTRDGAAPTPLHALPALAASLGIASLHVKDEGARLGLGSFKALGGAYAVARLVLEEAERRLGRRLGVEDLGTPDVRAVAATMTFACATDGNHGRSVAQGAGLCGARSAIFVHAGVSDGRVAAIARYGAEMIRVAGTYDDSVETAAAVAARNGWTVVSDTAWPGYERIPGLVMQGYTVLAREALAAMPAPPTHVFLQAGVGGFAAAVAGHLADALGPRRPVTVVVEPARAACLLGSAHAGRRVRIDHAGATVMAMLECNEPSLVAWRMLARLADGFMTVDEDDAVAAMNRLARPLPGDPAIVAGESGCVGYAGLAAALSDPRAAGTLGLGPGSRVLVVNTEGATDPAVYRQLVGRAPEDVRTGAGGAVP
jgi:diaminopropionate ammonia-lyase